MIPIGFLAAVAWLAGRLPVRDRGWRRILYLLANNLAAGGADHLRPVDFSRARATVARHLDGRAD